MKKLFLTITLLLIANQSFCGWFNTPARQALGIGCGLIAAQQARAEYKYRQARPQEKNAIKEYLNNDTKLQQSKDKYRKLVYDLVANNKIKYVERVRQNGGPFYKDYFVEKFEGDSNTLREIWDLQSTIRQNEVRLVQSERALEKITKDLRTFCLSLLLDVTKQN